MARNRILLLSAICAIGTGQPAVAAKHSCNTDRIRAEFNTSEGVPDLTGCKPDSIRPILSNYDYGLVVQNKVPSETIGSGRIVSQRVSDGYVYVDVSAGSNQSDHVGEKVAVGLVGALFGAILAAPKKKPPPPEQPPAVEPTPPPVATGVPLAPTQVEPAPAPPPIVRPTPVPPPPEPPQDLRPSATTEQQVAQATEPFRPQVKNPPPATEPPPAPPTGTPAVQPTNDLSRQIANDPSQSPIESKVSDPSAGRSPARADPPPEKLPAIPTTVTPDPSWWEKLLRALATVPLWARALAALAATAAVGTATVVGLRPRATCSIGEASVSLGGQPFKDRWPAIDVETLIGDPSFSIPNPLPIRRRVHAEPSPA